MVLFCFVVVRLVFGRADLVGWNVSNCWWLTEEVKSLFLFLCSPAGSQPEGFSTMRRLHLSRGNVSMAVLGREDWSSRSTTITWADCFWLLIKICCAAAVEEQDSLSCLVCGIHCDQVGSPWTWQVYFPSPAQQWRGCWGGSREMKKKNGQRRLLMH